MLVTTREQQLQVKRVIAKRDFASFLDFALIMEPPQAFAPGEGGRIPFIKWPYLMEVADIFANHSHVVILKSRQIGFSWLVSAYAVWHVLFKKGATVLMLSRGEKEAAALLDKAKFIYRNLPEAWQLPVGKDSGSEFTIPSMHSKIVALPSTKDAGRGETASVVIQDEADFHEYLNENYAAVGPTIDAGGQIIMGSTSNKMKFESLFKSVYKGAPQNGWKTCFIGWNDRPGRDMDWYEKRKANIPSDELGGLDPDFYMEQEYPASAEQALAPAHASAFFDLNRVNDMIEQAQKPITRQPKDGLPDDFRNLLSFWVRRTPRGRYVAGTDTAHGVGMDYSVTVVLDLLTQRVVADIMTNTFEPDDFAEASIDMLEYYQKPYWGIEDNEWGILVIRAAQRRRYTRLYHRTRPGMLGAKRPSQSAEPGWHTDERTRWPLWGELKQVFDPGELYIPNKAGLDQFTTVIRNPRERGRAEAMQGARDDYPMAVGIAYQMRKYAHASMSADKIVAIPRSN